MHRTAAVRLFAALLVAAAGVLFAVRPASALDWNFLLGDTELSNGNALSVTGIGDFLNSKGGGIASASFETPAGTQTAAEIIYSVGATHNISQKFLLVLLQKEQSLVTTVTPSQRAYNWATGFAVCDSCSTDDPGLQRYRGFYNQVNEAANRISNGYLADLRSRGYTISGWGPGITKTVDGIEVTPVNNATAALYTYTPHLQGNANFVRLWQLWFTRLFPDGTLLRDSDSGEYYVIEDGVKRKFRSVGVAASRYNVRKAITTSVNELGAYDTGLPILFPEYALLRSPRGTIFLVVEGQRRGIASKKVFRTLGFNPEEVLNVSWSDIDAMEIGPTVTLDSAYPTGALLQSATTGGIAYVENGVRHVITGKDIYRSRFGTRKPIRISDTELMQYPAGDPVLFRDGELVTAPGADSVYFISDGTKRPIASREVFDTLGFQWRNVITTNVRSLDIHPDGEPLALPQGESPALPQTTE